MTIRTLQVNQRIEIDKPTKDFLKGIIEKRKYGYMMRILPYQKTIGKEYRAGSSEQTWVYNKLTRNKKQRPDQAALEKFQANIEKNMRSAQKRLTDKLAQERYMKMQRKNQLENRINLLQQDLLMEMDSDLESQLIMDLVYEKIEEEEEKEQYAIRLENFQDYL